jgi:olefin beta-lactone synthetase
MSANIARHLSAMASALPGGAALKIPRGRDDAGRIDYLALTFAELEAEVAAWRERLENRGVRRGDRTLVMVRQGLPLIAAVFALFSLAAVPVVIDPGQGLRPFLRCVRHTRPRALVGIPLARWISRLAWRAFSSVEVRVAASSSLTSRLVAVARPRTEHRRDAAGTGPDELAAILFTSGSTGPAKGVCYTHGMFEAQVAAIRRTYGIEPGEIDLPMLPVFALFNPALGMTTVVPEIDPARPARVDPAVILQAIQQEAVTNSFGSPTLWRRILGHAAERGLTLPTLRRVLCAGAPVPPALWELSRKVLTGGMLHSPYGATEALPVSSVDAGTVIEETAEATRRGRGTCVGRPVEGVEVRILAPTDGPIGGMAEAGALPPGAIGEIAVTGPAVTRAYDGLPAATAGAKIPDPGRGTGAVWHRMGDCGYLDAEGRLWFCGRKAERVLTEDGVIHTEEVEPVVGVHPDVARCALVGVGAAGRQVPVLVVEPRAGRRADDAFRKELAALAAAHPVACRVSEILFHASLPVDVRHNAKIHRLTLARWAARRLGR